MNPIGADMQEPCMLRAQARRTHTRGVPPMDEDFMRDIIFLAKATRVRPALLVAGRVWGPMRLDLSHPGWPRLFYAKHVQIKPIPVHRRDAACPRPVASRTQRASMASGVRVLSPRASNARVWRPVSASCRLAHPTREYGTRESHPAAWIAVLGPPLRRI